MHQEQFEAIAGPRGVIQPTEALMYIQQAQTIAERRDFRATVYLSPRDDTKTGAHCHLSTDDAKQQTADHLLAGVLEPLPGLCTMSMPTHDCFGRMAKLAGNSRKWGFVGLGGQR